MIQTVTIWPLNVLWQYTQWVKFWLKYDRKNYNLRFAISPFFLFSPLSHTFFGSFEKFVFVRALCQEKVLQLNVESKTRQVFWTINLWMWSREIFYFFITYGTKKVLVDLMPIFNHCTIICAIYLFHSITYFIWYTF